MIFFEFFISCLSNFLTPEGLRKLFLIYFVHPLWIFDYQTILFQLLTVWQFPNYFAASLRKRIFIFALSILPVGKFFHQTDRRLKYMQQPRIPKLYLTWKKFFFQKDPLTKKIHALRELNFMTKCSFCVWVKHDFWLDLYPKKCIFCHFWIWFQKIQKQRSTTEAPNLYSVVYLFLFIRSQNIFFVLANMSILAVVTQYPGSLEE